MAKTKRKPMSLKSKDRLLTFSSVIATILPILIAVGINFNDYFIRRSAGFQIGFGGVLALILIILLAKGKSSVLKGVWGYLVVFIIAVCLQPILDDIVLLTGMALAGKGVDSVIIQPQLKRVRKRRESTENADILGNSIRQALEEQFNHLSGGNKQ